MAIGPRPEYNPLEHVNEPICKEIGKMQVQYFALRSDHVRQALGLTEQQAQKKMELIQKLMHNSIDVELLNKGCITSNIGEISATFFKNLQKQDKIDAIQSLTSQKGTDNKQAAERAQELYQKIYPLEAGSDVSTSDGESEDSPPTYVSL